MKYLLTSIDVPVVQVLPTCAALPQFTLEGSRQPPYKHCCVPVHFVPQVPQLLGSFVTSRQVPPQAACGVGHVHTPETHDAPFAHTLVQLPQLFTLLAVSRHAPSQTIEPTAQRHIPIEQV